MPSVRQSDTTWRAWSKTRFPIWVQPPSGTVAPEPSQGSWTSTVRYGCSKPVLAYEYARIEGDSSDTPISRI